MLLVPMLLGFRNTNNSSYKGSFSYAENDDINEKGYPEEFPVKNERLKNATANDVKKSLVHQLRIELADATRAVSFLINKTLSNQVPPEVGLQTGSNYKFVREWQLR
ncbi:hypothetical protein QT342_00465 [Escherichia coli]|nr:hypothetical protein [Escherichia coli]MDM4885076.1 hypothetical protein [Escherichia coli]